MKQLSSVVVFAALALAATACVNAAETAPIDKPNILLIISDDAGYSDFGFSGQKNFATPNLTELAESGVVFRQGYVSASVCSPSRAGLLTGRYQNRFGHEFNLPDKPGKGESAEMLGLPVDELTIADLLRQQGYYTGAIGKWHLGKERHFHPLNRGFEEFYGLLGGSRPYFAVGDVSPSKKILRNFEEEGFEGYLTDALGVEAERFIERNEDKPFFLYLSYTAVHAPMQSTEEKFAKYPHIKDEGRRNMAGMTESLDDSVGGVLNKLDQLGLAANTLVFFINDNGGSRKNFSINRPLKGFKGGPNEGGLRVPYLLRWPGKLLHGITYDPAVSALDILPTALAAAGIVPPADRKYDGVNLLPFLSQEGLENGADKPHHELYWRRGKRATVREGDLKLIRNNDGPNELYDLSKDMGERNNLLKKRHRDAARLSAKLDAWEAEMTEAVWKSGWKPKGSR